MTLPGSSRLFNPALLINLIVKKKLSRLNECSISFNYIERHQTCSIFMLSVISALHHVPHFMDIIWLFLVAVETEVDLQLLQTRCALIQLAMNRSRRVSAVLILMAVLLT